MLIHVHVNVAGKVPTLKETYPHYFRCETYVIIRLIMLSSRECTIPHVHP